MLDSLRNLLHVRYLKMYTVVNINEIKILRDIKHTI